MARRVELIVVSNAHPAVQSDPLAAVAAVAPVAAVAAVPQEPSNETMAVRDHINPRVEDGMGGAGQQVDKSVRVWVQHPSHALL